MNKFRFLSVVLATALGFALVSGVSNADIIEGITLERLGMLNTRATGSRPLSMGGAFTAVSDDAFAMIYNPAGLAQVRRKELSFGLLHAKNDITNRYVGYSAARSGSNTSLGHIAVVYPYPTYRGSLVLGFGVFNMGNSNLEYTKSGYWDDISTRIENRFAQTGSIYQYRFAVGFDISPRIALGGGLVIWDESVDFTEEFIQEDPGSTSVFTDVVSMNLDGFSMEFGMMMKMTENIRAGVMITTPQWLSYIGTGVEYYDGYYTAGGGWNLGPWSGDIDVEYTLPMKFAGGISFNIEQLLVAADVSYTDYSQTKYNGLKLANEMSRGTEVLDDTWNFNIGAEFTFPQFPVRVRGGYSYVPLSLPFVDEITYIVETPEEVFLEYIPEKYDLLKERQFFTFGIGGLIDRVLTLELGVVVGMYERESPDLTEKRETMEFTISGAYRF